MLNQNEVHSTNLKVGECIQEFKEEQVMDVERVECSESHVYEVYAEKTLPDGDFPAPRAIDEESQTFCAQEFATFTGLPYEESTLEFVRLTPSAETWAEGDRLITCLIQDPAGPVTSSLKDAKR